MHDDSNFTMITFLDAHSRIDSILDDMYEKIDFHLLKLGEVNFWQKESKNDHDTTKI